MAGSFLFLSSFLPLVDFSGPGSAKENMCLIAKKLFRLQDLAYASLSATTTRYSEPCGAEQPNLSSFALDDMVLFYHHLSGGQSHYLASIWLVTYCVIHCCYNDYSLGVVDIGAVIDSFNSWFLQVHYLSLQYIFWRLWGLLL